MGWSVRKKQYCGGGFGVLILVVGVALIPIVDYVVRKEIEKVRFCLQVLVLYAALRESILLTKYMCIS
jgi:uncharacterized membrane protein